MKKEISAGGVVIQKQGLNWNVLVIKDMNKQWTFPKGVVEAGENSGEAAAREIYEETGLTGIRELAQLPPIAYIYQRNGLIRKTVNYFVFLYPQDKLANLKPQTEEGITDVRWVFLDEAIKIIGYPKTNRELLMRTRQILQKQPEL